MPPPGSDVDFARAARRPLERLALVEHVAADPLLQETHFLEVKRELDLSSRGGAARAAKHLIGFANREPRSAAQRMDGHAYRLIGVEPGAVHGASTWDAADIQRWLEPFTGPALRYDVHHVAVDGATVLVLEVDAPREGDPIFCLQRTTQDEDARPMREGTIYVRRPGLTEMASASEIAMLDRRARAGGDATPRLELGVTSDDSELRALDPALLRDETRESYLLERESVLLADVPADDSGFAVLRKPATEFRSAVTFRAEVRAFARAAADDWFTFVAAHEAERDPALLRLIVANDTDRNFEDVVVEATISLPREAIHLSAGDLRETLDPPEEPHPWGEIGPLSSAWDRFERARKAEIERSGTESLVRFPPFRARPRTSHPLEPIVVVLPPERAGTEIEIRWRATAANTRGDTDGVLLARVRSVAADE